MALLVLPLAAPLSAQSSEQRRQVDAFRDTLQLVSDSALLGERESLLLRSAPRSRDDPFYHLYLGTLALRQGEVGGMGHFDEAAAEFRWSARLAPQWPYAWFGVGLAELGLGIRVGEDPKGRRAGLAREALSRASLAFGRAVSLEPGFAIQVESLTRRALRSGAMPAALALRDALARASPRSGRVLLALGRTQRALEDTAALASFTAYLALRENRPLGLLELGRTQLLLGDLSGLGRYLAAAGEPDPVVSAELRSDLAPLAAPAELVEFDRREGAGRAAFLRRFWTSRDRLELRKEGERLAEHLRRLNVARRDFLIIGADGSERFDDRGRIFIRHGNPDERGGLSAPGIEPNESWAYRGRGGAPDLILHFVARSAPSDFRLVESLQDITNARLGFRGREAGRGTQAILDEQLFRSRSSLDSRYRNLPSLPRHIAGYLSRERKLGRESILVATTSDRYPLRFARSLPALGTTLVAGSTGASPVLQVGFAVPARHVQPLVAPGRAMYSIRLRFVALDTTGTVVAALDSLLRISRAEALVPTEILTGRVAVAVRAGQLLTHLAVQLDREVGADLGILPITVPSPGSGELALGDLLIGSELGNLALPLSNGAEFLLSLPPVFSRQDELRLAVEAFGLSSDAQTTISVLVAPEPGQDAGSGSPRWRSYPDRRARTRIIRDRGMGPVTSWQGTLSVAKLSPGFWLIAVEARGPGSQRARREARIEVRDP